MAFCGLRIGEILGLRWSDVDLGRRRLFIRRLVIWRRKKECRPNEPRWIITEPKSEAGKRLVEIPGPLTPFLVSHREEQDGSPNPPALVFPSEDGTPFYPGDVRRRYFDPALKAIRLTGIRPHDFRRTFIAMHVEAGTHPKLVQTRVGHSNIKLTMDVYGKLAGEIALGEDQAARFDALAAKALPAPA
jgi:integrase